MNSILIFFLVLGWIGTILGFRLAYRVDKAWVKNYNKLVAEDNGLVEKHNVLVRGYNELLEIHKILIAYLQTSEKPTTVVNTHDDGKKRILN